MNPLFCSLIDKRKGRGGIITATGLILWYMNRCGFQGWTSFWGSIYLALGYELVYINGVYQNKNTCSVSGTSVVFSTAPPLTSLIEVMYN